MDVKVTHNFKLDACMKNREKLFDRIGQFMIRRILDRTQSQHVDADKTAFEPYSKSYLAQRAKKGRTAAVNLTFTGRMMANLRRGVVSKSNDHIEIGVSGDEIDKASYVEKGGREFLGVNDEDGEGIERIIDQWCDEQINEKL